MLMATGRLGDKTVNRIGFGTMQLAGPGVFGPPRDPEAARAVLRRAVELGVDHIDTAQYYGPDVVNELIRDTLHPYPEGLRLVTKVGARRDEGGAWLPALSAAELREGVEQNLRTLRIERLDLVNLRLMDSEAEGPLSEGLGTLSELREEGKLDLIGISTVPTEVVAKALDLADVASVQNPFSILDQGDRPTLELCHVGAAAPTCPTSRSARLSSAAPPRSRPTRRSPASPPSTAPPPRRSPSPGCSPSTTTCC